MLDLSSEHRQALTKMIYKRSIIIPLTILALAGAGVYYFLGRTAACPMDPPQDWKTYRSDPNILAGFEFKYPRSWFMQDDPYSFVQLLSEARDRPQKGEQAAEFGLDFYRGGFSEAIELAKAPYEIAQGNTIVTQVIDTAVAGKPGKKIVTKDPSRYSLVVSNRGIIYDISVSAKRLVHRKKFDCSNVMYEILKTFTFVRIE